MFAPLMAKGLIRLEGYIKRGKLENVSLCFALSVAGEALDRTDGGVFESRL